MNTTTRTVAQHLASKRNLCQRRYPALSDAAAAKREQWRRERVELTPTAQQARDTVQWGEAKGEGQDGTVHRVLQV